MLKVLQIFSVADQNHFDPDPDSDPTFQSDADTDPVLQFDAEPYPDPTT